MENRLFARSRSIGEDFLRRMISSILFIPLLLMVFILPPDKFYLLCFAVYIVMLYEIFSMPVQGRLGMKILASITCLVGLRSFMYINQFYGALGCVGLICITSGCDMGGYFFGKIFKGPKLCPTISPNKTWAGFIGSILCANCILMLLSDCFSVFLSLPLNRLLLLQVLIAASILGDLFESMFKRNLGVKDMGNIFPGHGGMMDRFDSLMFSSIVFTVLDLWDKQLR